MKGYSNIVSLKHRLGIILGLIAAVIIVTTDCVSTSENYYQTAVRSVKKKDNKKEDKDSQATFLSVAQDLIVPASPLVITQDWHFLGDIGHENDHKVEFIPKRMDGFNSWFKTLFRQIISPNAP